MSLYKRDPMTLYLSGPMTGITEFNYPAFQRACYALRDMGHTVVSPHEVAHQENGVVGSLPWRDYLMRDIHELTGAKCSAIVMLAGWAKSRGARLELSIALALDFEVFYIQRDDLVIDMQAD